MFSSSTELDICVCACICVCRMGYMSRCRYTYRCMCVHVYVCRCIYTIRNKTRKEEAAHPSTSSLVTWDNVGLNKMTSWPRINVRILTRETRKRNRKSPSTSCFSTWVDKAWVQSVGQRKSPESFSQRKPPVSEMSSEFAGASRANVIGQDLTK